MESWDVHFDESELVEPTRVRIETEISQSKEVLPVKREKQAESDSDSSVDLQDLLDGDSDDDDDGYDSDTSSEGYGTAGSSGSNARSSSVPDNDKNHCNGSATNFRATPMSLTESATSKTPKSTGNHLRNTNNSSTHPYQAPSIPPDELCRLMRIRRAPVPDDNDRYSKTSYGSQSAHKSSGGVGVAAGEARGNDNEGNMTQVTGVTTESANAAILGDPISYTMCCCNVFKAFRGFVCVHPMRDALNQLI